MHEVSNQSEATGWVPEWHWEHDNLPYHTKAEPNNDYLSYLQVTKVFKKDNIFG